MKKYYVYHIYPKGSEWGTDKGYIGYSDDVEERMKKHDYDRDMGDDLFVHEAMRVCGDCEYETLSTHYSKSSALDEEMRLRPDECMGWNMAEGGNSFPFSGKCLWTDVELTKGKK